MLINGLPDYDRDGNKYKTCLVIAKVCREGEGVTSKRGKFWAKLSVVAYTGKDGSASFLEIKNFGNLAVPIANTKRGDMIIAAGRLSERVWEGRTYVSMMADFFQNLTEQSISERKEDAESKLDGLEKTISQFSELSDADSLDGELPF